MVLKYILVGCPCSQPSQSTAKKYDKWTNDQQRYLIQLWADKQDMINSKDSRNAWREIAEAINNKFKTNKTVDKCLRKIEYLIDAYKEKKNGTEIRPVVTCESLFSMMKLMPFWVAAMPRDPETRARSRGYFIGHIFSR